MSEKTEKMMVMVSGVTDTDYIHMATLTFQVNKNNKNESRLTVLNCVSMPYTQTYETGVAELFSIT
jgi:hypothetical protein